MLALGRKPLLHLFVTDEICFLNSVVQISIMSQEGLRLLLVRSWLHLSECSSIEYRVKVLFQICSNRYKLKRLAFARHKFFEILRYDFNIVTEVRRRRFYLRKFFNNFLHMYLTEA